MDKKLLIIGLLGLLSACGSKGDLFLEPPKEIQQPADPSEIKAKDGKHSKQQKPTSVSNSPEPVSS